MLRLPAFAGGYYLLLYDSIGKYRLLYVPAPFTPWSRQSPSNLFPRSLSLVLFRERDSSCRTAKTRLGSILSPVSDCCTQLFVCKSLFLGKELIFPPEESVTLTPPAVDGGIPWWRGGPCELDVVSWIVLRISRKNLVGHEGVGASFWQSLAQIRSQEERKFTFVIVFAS